MGQNTFHIYLNFHTCTVQAMLCGTPYPKSVILTQTVGQVEAQNKDEALLVSVHSGLIQKFIDVQQKIVQKDVDYITKYGSNPHDPTVPVLRSNVDEATKRLDYLREFQKTYQLTA